MGPHIVRKLLEDKAVEHVIIPSTGISSAVFDSFGIVSNKVKLIHGDIRKYSFVQKLFNEYEFDTVFHLAAVSEVRECQNNAKLAFDTNIGGTVNILEAARGCNYTKAVVVSSSYRVYGKSPLPYREDYPLKDKGTYETSKICADLIARSYFNNYKLPVVVTRCSNLYGPGDLHCSRIIPNTIRLALRGEPPVVYTSAKNLIREFLYIEDAVRAYFALVENIDKTAGEAYNIGSGEKTSIDELVKEILNTVSPHIQISYEENNFSEIMNQYLDSSKIENDTGWSAQIALAEGLNRTVQYYKEQE